MTDNLVIPFLTYAEAADEAQYLANHFGHAYAVSAGDLTDTFIVCAYSSLCIATAMDAANLIHAYYPEEDA